MPIVHVDPAPAAYVGVILTAVRSFDQARVGAILNDADATHGIDTTVDEIVFPALRVVGTLWASGTMDVAHEHLLSVAVARWVASKSPSRPGIARKGTILLAAGPQDMHTLALDCLDLLLTGRGVEVCNLGAQTPVSSLLVAARSLHPTAVVLSSQTPTVASDAVRSVKAIAEAGIPVYLAGSSFALQFFRQNAPGTPLDATLRQSAEMLTTRYTTTLPDPGNAPRERYPQSRISSPLRPAPTATKTGRDAAAAVVARAMAGAREVQAFEAAQAVISTRRAVQAAAETAALAAGRARTRRAAAASSAAEAVASSAGRAAVAVQRQADASATTLREAAARAATIVAAASPPGGDREAALAALHLAAAAQAAALTAARETATAAAGVATTVVAAATQTARTVSELDVTIENEVADTAVQVQSTAAATARELAAEIGARAANAAIVAREAVAAANILDTYDNDPQDPKARSLGESDAKLPERLSPA